MIIGFLIAVPVGPMGLLCIRRALADGCLAAFVVGLGAAVADTFYAMVAGLGLTLVSGVLLEYRTVFSLAGGVALVLLGWTSWRQFPGTAPSPLSPVHLGLLKDFTLSLCLTLVNPATILAFMAVFAFLGAMHPSDGPTHAVLLIGGVFMGSTLWWLTLSALAGTLRHKFSERWLVHLNRVFGSLLVVCGIGILIIAFYRRV